MPLPIDVTEDAKQIDSANSNSLQPQRPRAWRVRDENLPPTSIAPTKSIHQRNKSTPALSTLLQVGANKMPTKRTVFADVSNTAGTRSDHHPAKDDLILHAKATNNVLSVKPSTLAMKENASSLAPLPEITKPSALLRPAQRPLSSIAQKAPTASTAVADIIATAASKNALAESNVQMGKPGRTLSKRQTMIFKENVPVDVATNIMPLIAYSDASSASIQAPIASEVLDVLQKAVKDTSAKQEGVALPQDEAPGAKTAIEPVEVISAKDVLALKAAEVVPDLDFPVPRSYSELIPLNIPNESCAIQQLDFPTSLLPENLEPLLDLPPSVVELIETHNEKFARHSLNPPSAEPEEYWDEEEEEEYYDADGYTTARSVRSRGDTTGAVTVVMEPRITAKVERELVTAKLYVESIKTPEDVEDEAWDTSMVAEYGDEIFTYMHDLEVYCLTACHRISLANCLPEPHEAKSALYGQPNGNPVVNACGSHGLASPSSSSLHAASRDVVLECQLR